jgi:hypothetical protein
MRRRETWKQGNPRDQAIVVATAAAGLASNISEGIYPDDKLKVVSVEIETLLFDIVGLIHDLPSGQWDL